MTDIALNDNIVRLLTASKHNFAENLYLDINVETWAKPMPACVPLAAIMTKPNHTRETRFQTISKRSHHYYFSYDIISQKFGLFDNN